MKVENRSKMGWFWFAIAMAVLLTFAALVKEGTVKLPIASGSDAVSASDTTSSEEPELTTAAEVTLTTAESSTTTTTTTASEEPTLTTAAAQQEDAAPLDTAAVRTIILDNYGKKYHLDENCVAAGMIAEENRETAEISIDEAKSRDYLPCDMCAAGD